MKSLENSEIYCFIYVDYINAMNKKILRQAVACVLRHMPECSLPILSGLPRVGKFAEAFAYWQHPFQTDVPNFGVRALLHVARETSGLTLQPVAGNTGAIVRHSTRKEWNGLKVALLAHWDASAEVAPYVRYYANALHQQGYDVVLATSGVPRLVQEDLDVFSAVVCRQSHGYDFTSWRAAFEALPSLFEASEILLTNDSMYGPVGPLDPLYKAMENTPCDFWGIIESNAVEAHLQSYFIVLYKNAIKSSAFKEFLSCIGMSSCKVKAIGYELAFSRWLVQNGQRAAVRFPDSVFSPTSLNPSHYAWDTLLKTGFFPFIKRELLFENPYAVPLKNVTSLLEINNYPRELIKNTLR